MLRSGLMLLLLVTMSLMRPLPERLYVGTVRDVAASNPDGYRIVVSVDGHDVEVRSDRSCEIGDRVMLLRHAGQWRIVSPDEIKLLKQYL